MGSKKVAPSFIALGATQSMGEKHILQLIVDARVADRHP
jgi:hypothetical protein